MALRNSCYDDVNHFLSGESLEMGDATRGRERRDIGRPLPRNIFNFYNNLITRISFEYLNNEGVACLTKFHTLNRVMLKEINLHLIEEHPSPSTMRRKEKKNEKKNLVNETLFFHKDH